MSGSWLSRRGTRVPGGHDPEPVSPLAPTDAPCGGQGQKGSLHAGGEFPKLGAVALRQRGLDPAHGLRRIARARADLGEAAVLLRALFGGQVVDPMHHVENAVLAAADLAKQLRQTVARPGCDRGRGRLLVERLPEAGHEEAPSAPCEGAQQRPQRPAVEPRRDPAAQRRPACRNQHDLADLRGWLRGWLRRIATRDLLAERHDLAQAGPGLLFQRERARSLGIELGAQAVVGRRPLVERALHEGQVRRRLGALRRGLGALRREHGACCLLALEQVVVASPGVVDLVLQVAQPRLGRKHLGLGDLRVGRRGLGEGVGAAHPRVEQGCRRLGRLGPRDGRRALVRRGLGEGPGVG